MDMGQEQTQSGEIEYLSSSTTCTYPSSRSNCAQHQATFYSRTSLYVYCGYNVMTAFDIQTFIDHYPQAYLSMLALSVFVVLSGHAILDIALASLWHCLKDG